MTTVGEYMAPKIRGKTEFHAAEEFINDYPTAGIRQ